MKFSELQDKCKQLTKEIRTLKSTRKQYPDGVPGLWRAKYDFRHHHIAASELRGKTREQIEIPTRAYPVNEDVIKAIKDSIEPREARDEQDVCCDA